MSNSFNILIYFKSYRINQYFFSKIKYIELCSLYVSLFYELFLYLFFSHLIDTILYFWELRGMGRKCEKDGVIWGKVLDEDKMNYVLLEWSQTPKSLAMIFLRK